jgi:hypothetical protein
MLSNVIRVLDTAVGDRVVPLLMNAGAPVNGTTFAGVAQPGWLLIDTTNTNLYQNINTKASPTWSLFESSNDPGVFTTISTTGLAALNSIEVDTGTKTASATTGAATLNKNAGVITSESLSTAAGAVYTLTLTNSNIAAADQVYASVQYGSSTTGSPAIMTVATAAGSATIKVQNINASAALNGTIKISFLVVKN